jgi:hypothetical protein
MILFAGLAGVVGFFFANRYPRYDRAVFTLEDFGPRENGEYFIVTQEELRDVKARRRYRLAAP